MSDIYTHWRINQEEWKRTTAIVAKVRNEIIEECARVAESLAPEPDGAPDFVWTATDSRLLNLATEIATNIRALIK